MKQILLMIAVVALVGCSSTSALVSCTECKLKDGKIYANSDGRPFSGRVGLFDERNKALLASVNVSRGLVNGLDVFEEDGAPSVKFRFVKSFKMEQLEAMNSNKPPDFDLLAFSEKGVEVMNFSLRGNSLKGSIRNDEGKRICRMNANPNNGGGKIEAWYPNGSKRLNLVTDGKDNFSGDYWDSDGVKSSDNIQKHAQDFFEDNLAEIMQNFLRKLEDGMSAFGDFNFN
jgi:hypothetical protein